VLSKKLSGAQDYFGVATAAVGEMLRQTGEAQYDGEGIMRRGVIVRHLVLPGHTMDSLKVLGWCRDNLPRGTPVSVMAQYTPMGGAADYPPLGRRLKKAELCPGRGFRDGAAEGLEGYMQELSSAKGNLCRPSIWRGCKKG
jgi:putative pyruvate formate lyase activating enzyme